MLGCRSVGLRGRWSERLCRRWAIRRWANKKKPSDLTWLIEPSLLLGETVFRLFGHNFSHVVLRKHEGDVLPYLALLHSWVEWTSRPP